MGGILKHILNLKCGVKPQVRPGEGCSARRGPHAHGQHTQHGKPSASAQPPTHTSSQVLSPVTLSRLLDEMEERSPGDDEEAMKLFTQAAPGLLARKENVLNILR